MSLSLQSAARELFAENLLHEIITPHMHHERGLRREQRGAVHGNHLRHAHGDARQSARMQRELQSEIPRAGEQARHGGVRGDERLFGVHGRARAHRLRRQESTQHSRPGILRPPGASAHTDRHHRHQGQDHHRVLHARHHQRAEWKHDGIVLVGGQLRGRHALRGIRPHDARIARRGAHDARGGEQRHEIPGDGGLSQAYKVNRVYDFHFDVAAFLNISPITSAPSGTPVSRTTCGASGRSYAMPTCSCSASAATTSNCCSRMPN